MWLIQTSVLYYQQNMQVQSLILQFICWLAASFQKLLYRIEWLSGWVAKWCERCVIWCIISPAGGGAVRLPGAMCLPHTNNMDNKLQGAGPGGGASLRPRAGGVSLEPFIHQVGRNGVCFGKASMNVADGESLCSAFCCFHVCARRWGVTPVWCVTMITRCASLWSAGSSASTNLCLQKWRSSLPSIKVSPHTCSPVWWSPWMQAGFC